MIASGGGSRLIFRSNIFPMKSRAKSTHSELLHNQFTIRAVLRNVPRERPWNGFVSSIEHPEKSKTFSGATQKKKKVPFSEMVAANRQRIENLADQGRPHKVVSWTSNQSTRANQKGNQTEQNPIKLDPMRKNGDGNTTFKFCCANSITTPIKNLEIS